ncbi:heme-degrading domain-containing protein [Devosia marina]|uniref:Heme-degrading domain-containing protein n=1 Tax=Devosia marina TaxID=2683198 RepID=A0A7X3K372_9HYPH|nr:heme-degrading domain-containing protein [Devosia marina]MVS98660.1 heme-degrading domain-containing protein [Devosia marina]
MSKQDDIVLVTRQENELVLSRFDEAVAFEIGAAIRGRALNEGLSLVVDLRTWDRQLFFSATPGTSADNAEWVRRKINSVRRFQRASYRLVLERGEAPFPTQSGADPADFVIAGGGFPIRVTGAGIIGCLTISGLPGRKDHGVAVDALCDFLGKVRADYALAEATN